MTSMSEAVRGAGELRLPVLRTEVARHAECRGIDVDRFEEWAPLGQNVREERAAALEALTVCDACPVAAACAELSLRTERTLDGDRYAPVFVRGGLVPRELRALEAAERDRLVVARAADADGPRSARLSVWRRERSAALSGLVYDARGGRPGPVAAVAS